MKDQLDNLNEVNSGCSSVHLQAYKKKHSSKKEDIVNGFLNKL